MVSRGILFAINIDPVMFELYVSKVSGRAIHTPFVQGFSPKFTGINIDGTDTPLLLVDAVSAQRRLQSSKVIDEGQRVWLMNGTDIFSSPGPFDLPHFYEDPLLSSHSNYLLVSGKGGASLFLTTLTLTGLPTIFPSLSFSEEPDLLISNLMEA